MNCVKSATRLTAKCYAIQVTARTVHYVFITLRLSSSLKTQRLSHLLVSFVLTLLLSVTQSSKTTQHRNQWVTQGEFNIPLQSIISDFGLQSLNAINCNGTDNSTQHQEKIHRKKLARNTNRPQLRKTYIKTKSQTKTGHRSESPVVDNSIFTNL